MNSSTGCATFVFYVQGSLHTYTYLSLPEVLEFVVLQLFADVDEVLLNPYHPLHLVTTYHPLQFALL